MYHDDSLVIGSGPAASKEVDVMACWGCRGYPARWSLSGLRFGAEVVRIGIDFQGTITNLASDERTAADIVMYSAGRQGVTNEFDLENVGLAATAPDQGRLAAYYAFGEPVHELQKLRPIGIYAVPEISITPGIR